MTSTIDLLDDLNRDSDNAVKREAYDRPFYEKLICYYPGTIAHSRTGPTVWGKELEQIQDQTRVPNPNCLPCLDLNHEGYKKTQLLMTNSSDVDPLAMQQRAADIAHILMHAAIIEVPLEAVRRISQGVCHIVAEAIDKLSKVDGNTLTLSEYFTSNRIGELLEKEEARVILTYLQELQQAHDEFLDILITKNNQSLGAAKATWTMACADFVAWVPWTELEGVMTRHYARYMAHPTNPIVNSDESAQTSSDSKNVHFDHAKSDSGDNEDGEIQNQEHQLIWNGAEKEKQKQGVLLQAGQFDLSEMMKQLGPEPEHQGNDGDQQMNQRGPKIVQLSPQFSPATSPSHSKQQQSAHQQQQQQPIKRKGRGPPGALELLLKRTEAKNAQNFYAKIHERIRGLELWAGSMWDPKQIEQIRKALDYTSKRGQYQSNTMQTALAQLIQEGPVRWTAAHLRFVVAFVNDPYLEPATVQQLNKDIVAANTKRIKSKKLSPTLSNLIQYNLESGVPIGAAPGVQPSLAPGQFGQHGIIRFHDQASDAVELKRMIHIFNPREGVRGRSVDVAQKLCAQTMVAALGSQSATEADATLAGLATS